MATQRVRPKFYFDCYESRKAPDPLPYSLTRELLFQFLATLNMAMGAWYISWRWTSSLNYDALWFAIPMVLAETMAYFGMVFFSINLWFDRPPEIPPPPKLITECVRDHTLEPRPISVDVFFPTYTEDPELVRLSIMDAKLITYPYPIDMKIHVLDDGKRPAMKAVAEEEGVRYITRDNNEGYKAGNILNAMEQTSGDFILICDADTRPFPTILAHVLGYFRDPDMAWVQTPQWFFDIPEGERLPEVWRRKLGLLGELAGKALEAVWGPVVLGADPFANDARVFYEVILKRRDAFNASFCCGAGSIHRREAVMQGALRRFADAVEAQVTRHAPVVEDPEIREAFTESMKRELVQETPVTPYMFHVSEDIYTSLMVHSDPERRWKSRIHPWIQSKMLSPQDLHTWVVQRFKYAAGSLDICLRHNPITQKNLTLGQRLMYGLTYYSYLSSLWTVIFLIAPGIYLVTGIAPVSAYSFDFFKHLAPFMFLNKLVLIVGTWGLDGWRAEQFFTAFFPEVFRAVWVVLKREKIKFPVTAKERQAGNYLHLVRFQLAVIAFSLGTIAYGWIHWIYQGARSDAGGLIINTFWGLNNVFLLSGIVQAAVWKPKAEESQS